VASNRSILWFRRDLRLRDHPALVYAARDRRMTVPVFVIDPALVQRSGAPRLAFLYRSLHALNDSMDGQLVVRHGDPATVIAQLARKTGADEVVVTRDYAPYGRRRDGAVSAALSADGVAFVGKGSAYAVDPGGVVKADGDAYSVFTPFARAWLAKGWNPPTEQPVVQWRGASAFGSDQIPPEPELRCQLPEAGEPAALHRWKEFAESMLDRYDELRDLPGVDGTSGLSPYLRWGQLHPRQLLVDLDDSRAHATFRSELAWREFYADVLFRLPHTARENLQQKMNNIDLDTDDAALDRFAVWAAGRTGYPFVDAGMRQLLATGWMHNRVRMVTASFLVKDLHLPWQWGARHFMRHLVDADLASNQHGWQWVAGTGTDAAPYFRVFNPVAQSQRFDPDGTYIRKWVPELAALAGAPVHTPWTNTDDLARNMPSRLVDHAVERIETLRRYQTAMGR
jgi:deoxyribodipyrimidine photo-lyase